MGGAHTKTKMFAAVTSQVPKPCEQIPWRHVAKGGIADAAHTHVEGSLHTARRKVSESSVGIDRCLPFTLRILGSVHIKSRPPPSAGPNAIITDAGFYM